MERTSRRSLLKAAIVAGISASTAGCLDSISTLAGQDTDQNEFERELEQGREVAKQY